MIVPNVGIVKQAMRSAVNPTDEPAKFPSLLVRILIGVRQVFTRIERGWVSDTELESTQVPIPHSSKSLRSSRTVQSSPVSFAKSTDTMAGIASEPSLKGVRDELTAITRQARRNREGDRDPLRRLVQLRSGVPGPRATRSLPDPRAYSRPRPAPARPSPVPTNRHRKRSPRGPGSSTRCRRAVTRDRSPTSPRRRQPPGRPAPT